MTESSEAALDTSAWLTLADLQAVALQRRRRLALSALTGVLFAAAYLVVAEPKFESTMVVQPVVPPTQSGGGLPLGLGALASQFGVGGGGDASPYFVQSVMTSRDIAIDVLGQAVPAEFCGATTQQPISVWDCFLESTEGEATAKERAAAVDELRSSLSVDVDPLSGTLEVTVTARTGELAAFLVSTLVQQTNAKLTALNQQQSEAEQLFLRDLIAEYSDSLAQAEGVLRTFLERNRTIGSPEQVFEERRLQGRWTFFNGIVESLHERAQAARLSEVRDTPVITVVDQSEVPAEESWPKPLIILLASTIAATAAGFFTALVSAARSTLHSQ